MKRKQEKERSNTLFIISVGLIFLAIIVTAVLTRVRNSRSQEDIRAKAGEISDVVVAGTVGSIDPTTSTFLVDNVSFVYKSRNDSETSLGTWTVTPPQGYPITSLQTGSQIKLTVIASTFDIKAQTMTASKIE